ncbi:MAG: hypothetical protein ACR2PL_19915 [Dehalococcoidia bacterium]
MGLGSLLLVLLLLVVVARAPAVSPVASSVPATAFVSGRPFLAASEYPAAAGWRGLEQRLEAGFAGGRQSL